MYSELVELGVASEETKGKPSPIGTDPGPAGFKKL